MMMKQLGALIGRIRAAFRRRFPVTMREHDRTVAGSSNPRLRLLFRLRRMVAVLLLLAAALFVAFNLQLFTPESLSTLRSSLSAQQKQGDSTTITYPSGLIDSAVPFGSALALTDSASLHIVFPGDFSLLKSSVAYANPALRATDQYLLVFDREGNRFTVTNTLQELYHQSTSSPIIDADIGTNGSVAIVTDEAGYKSGVTVYNAANEKLYNWYSSNYYIMSAALSPNKKHLALFTFKQEGTETKSRLFFADTTRDMPVSEDGKAGSSEPETGVDLGNSLVLDMKFIDKNTLCVVCDDGVYLVSRRGKIKYQKDYPVSSLIAFDFSDDRLALALKSYSKSSRAELTLISAGGRESKRPLELNDEPDSISYNNGKLAVLTGDTLRFYNAKLKLLDEQDGMFGCSRVFMRDDSTAVCLFSGHARIAAIGKTLT